MNILHIIPSYKPAYKDGGPIESVSSLCESLYEIGNNVNVFTTTANGNNELDVPTSKPINVDGVKVIYFPRLTKGNTHVSPALWLYLFKYCNNYDIVHIHSWWNPLVVISAFICHLKGTRVIISPRGMVSHYILTKTNAIAKKIIHKLLGEYALKKSFFHSTSEIEHIECQNLIKGWQGFLLPNLINLPSENFIRENNKTFTLIFLSRIHPKKGLEYLFEAISYLKEPIVLKIAGTGEEHYINKLQEYSRALGVDHLIEWVGWKSREDKYKELANSDLFVLTSFNENFANVVIESLYVGTPVLVTDTVGLASFVDENNIGWVTKFEPNAIAESLKLAMVDSSKRYFVNSSGRTIVLNNFSRSILVKKYLEQYNLICDDKFSQNVLTEEIFS